MRTSGVITCFNHELYIGAAIDSLAPQVDELIVVDDCSLDASPDIIGRRTSAHPNVRLLRLEHNRGPSAAFNAGAEVATGDVLFLQGGDDLSLPGRVEHQVSLLDGVDMVYGPPRIIDGASRVLPDFSGREFFPALPVEDPDPLPVLFQVGNFICAPSVAVRTESFWRLGPFDEQLELVQDYLLWMRIAAEGAMCFSEKRVVEYRKHSGNLSSRQPSFDSPLNRRLAAEFAVARLRALEAFPSDVLWRLLRRCDTPIPLPEPPADHVQRWLLCLLHDSAALRSAAVAQAADGSISQDDLKGISEEPRHLLRQLLVMADVESMQMRENLFASMRRHSLTVADLTGRQ